ncbi:MAG TPA: TlyA family RNA methyltransferase [Anaerolineales bacterium]|nr:TlyA family RNA methyltransferase [Anaerolineales bacterium]
MPKTRLDLLLVERGLAESRAKAQALVMAGQVRVEGQVELKASTAVAPEAHLDLDSGPRFVSRGGEKLEAALDAFPVDPAGQVCADVGASTGGFTDCLLQHGAVKVYAIDVGKGILHWKLRSDPRVIVMEETNARRVESLPEQVGLVVIDASFISLKILLPVVKNWLGPAGQVLALIKPQFEAGRKESARHKGVIRDPDIHRAVLIDVLAFARAQGFNLGGLARSPVLGPKGNVEFLAWLTSGRVDTPDLTRLVEGALAPTKKPEGAG